jgi:hypothetical protein
MQNKHGEWTYQDPAWPGWIYPLSKNRWIRREPHFVTSDGRLSINKLLALAGQSAPANAHFFAANPNLRNTDPNVALPSGTIVNVPHSWEANLSTAGLKMNQVGVGAQQPCPPGQIRYPDGCHPMSATQLANNQAVQAQSGGLLTQSNLATAAAQLQQRPCPPGQTRWADGTCHPLPPSSQPQVTTGWVTAPSGHRWYRDASHPGWGWNPTQNQWVQESQLALAAAIASGDTVGAQQLQYAMSGGAVQSQMAQNAQQQAALTAGQQQYGGWGGVPVTPVATGWIQGPQGSWRYNDARYPGYAYDRGQGRWMSLQDLQTMYGG